MSSYQTNFCWSGRTMFATNFDYIFPFITFRVYWKLCTCNVHVWYVSSIDTHRLSEDNILNCHWRNGNIFRKKKIAYDCLPNVMEDCCTCNFVQLNNVFTCDISHELNIEYEWHMSGASEAFDKSRSSGHYIFHFPKCGISGAFLCFLTSSTICKNKIHIRFTPTGGQRLKNQKK